MAIDTSIYGNLLARPKSAVDYQQDYANLDLQQQQKQGNALAMQSTQRKFAAEDAAAAQAGRLRNALSLAKDEAERADVYDRFGMIKEATDLRAAPVERNLKAAQAGKAQGEALDAGLGRYRKALDMVQTPQQAVEWLKAQYADPVVGEYVGKIGGPIMAAARQIPVDPVEFEKWRAKAQMGIEKHMQEQRQQAELALNQQRYGLDAANKVMTPDPNMPGGFRVNTPFVNAEMGMRKAGASNTTINTGQKGLDNELKVRDDFRAEPVYKAHQEMQSAYSQIQQSLKQASPAGDLAAATKMMKLLDPGSVVRESELGMAMAATGLEDRIMSFVPNIINGTKLSPDQRKQFQALADALFNESTGQYNAKRSEYADLAGGYGLNADRLLGPSAAPPKVAPKPGAKPGAAPAAGGMPSLDMSAIEAELARRGGK